MPGIGRAWSEAERRDRGTREEEQGRNELSRRNLCAGNEREYEKKVEESRKTMGVRAVRKENGEEESRSCSNSEMKEREGGRWSDGRIDWMGRVGRS